MIEIVTPLVALIVGAAWMLKHLINRMDKQDERINSLVDNHLAHSTQALVDLKNVIQQLLTRERGK